MEALFTNVVRMATMGIEALGVLVIVVGIGLAGVQFVLRHRDLDGYQNLRRSLGRSILLGLELLVAADIVNTVAVEPTLDRVLVLAAIVAIRTFLSLSLEVEVSGSWPWARRQNSADGGVHGSDRQ